MQGGKRLTRTPTFGNFIPHPRDEVSLNQICKDSQASPGLVNDNVEAVRDNVKKVCDNDEAMRGGAFAKPLRMCIASKV